MNKAKIEENPIFVRRRTSLVGCLRADEEVLRLAINRGVLSAGANLGDLTGYIRQRLIDSYVLSDAKYFGYLPNDASLDDLSKGVREKMHADGKMQSYNVRGEVDEGAKFI